jgi:hypothetical protein
MIGTSVSICLPAPIAGIGKNGFFAPGAAAKKKLYTAEYAPSSAGERGLIFALLPLPHAGAEISPSFHGTAHGATIRVSRHCTTGDFQTPQRSPAWATSASGSIRAVRPQSRNLMKPYKKVNYGLKDKQSTRERKP